MRVRQLPRRREQGAIVILMALLITTLVVIVALVIDYGFVRDNRQVDKSAGDFAAAAGIRALDDGLGKVQPWKGICAARSFLVVNDDKFASLSGTYENGDASVTYATDPCADTASAPYTTRCASNSPATWARYIGTADGGRLEVRIEAGYTLPDATFPEDAASYSGDSGASSSGGCDHLAVIVSEREDAYFGGVAGASDYETRIRSVARLNIRDGGLVAPSLLLLERQQCSVLLIGGSSGAVVRAEGFGNDPGVVHADTAATDPTTCDATDEQNGNVFQVNSNPPDPRIIVAAAADDSAPGELTAVAMGAPSPSTALITSPRPTEVCVEAASGDCATPTSADPEYRELVSRSVVDMRYLTHVTALRSEAASRFAWDAPTRSANGFQTVACGAVIPNVEKVWVDCSGGNFDGAGKTFGSNVREVVINGYVTVGGNNNTLQFATVEKLYIRGQSGGAAVSLAGSEGNTLAVNTGSSPTAACPETAADVSATTKVVLGSGWLESAGGSSSAAPKALRMCQAMVLMSDDSASSCTISSARFGTAPYPNSCLGYIRIAGQATVDWTAPNLNADDADPAPDYSSFEDLAFWTETQASGVEWGIVGNGNVKLGGIFFSPNADPIRVGGNGTYDITDAQFVTRRLQVTGNAALTLRPDPRNSVTIPGIGGFTLVR